MYFLSAMAIKYHMFTKKRVVLLIIIALLLVVVPLTGMLMSSKVNAKEQRLQMLTVWQIDGFEGGKGSRAQYLKDKGEECFENRDIYINVISLTQEAAADNIRAGRFPDMISYSPTFNAHLGYINNRDFMCKNWCFGSYCLLTLDENADFNDVNAKNTVINAGTGNLSNVAAAMCGIAKAAQNEPTQAYLNLLNGKYKYLFGTQRDIFRLNMRGASYCVKQVVDFNDLYQNISIMTKDEERYISCREYVNFLTDNNEDIDKLGLMSANSVGNNELIACLNVKKFDYELKLPCGDDYLNELKSAAANNDLNKIKNLLK